MRINHRPTAPLQYRCRIFAHEFYLAVVPANDVDANQWRCTKSPHPGIGIRRVRVSAYDHSIDACFAQLSREQTAMGSKTERERIVAALLATHGLTFAGELGIALEKNRPPVLFRWWCASLLLSARIRTPIAMRAAEALFASGWTTAQKLADSHWDERVRILNQAGYARYDESTASMLGDGATRLLDEYRGDLRNLRAQADRKPQEERRLLKEFKGIGDVGANIFCREVQGVWHEHYPFADAKALQAARALGLGEDVHQLAALVDRADFVRLVAALVRANLLGDCREIRAGR
jgi:hypothetical protein